jgi:hypothetical protein
MKMQHAPLLLSIVFSYSLQFFIFFAKISQNMKLACTAVSDLRFEIGMHSAIEKDGF